MKFLSGVFTGWWLFHTLRYVGYVGNWNHPIFATEPRPLTIICAMLLAAMYFLRDVIE